MTFSTIVQDQESRLEILGFQRAKKKEIFIKVELMQFKNKIFFQTFIAYFFIFKLKKVPLRVIFPISASGIILEKKLVG